MAAADYLPLDLSAITNAGVDALVAAAAPTRMPWQPALSPEPPLGACMYRGLPFVVGAVEPDPQRCFVVLEPGAPPLNVPVGMQVHNIVVAHRELRATSLVAIDAGEPVATYRFAFDDGAEEAVPVRTRFEIWGAPAEPLTAPFLAVADIGTARVADRDSGRWERAGWRHCEGEMAQFDRYWLWVWTNPRPEVAVRAMTFEAGAHSVLVAAVTLGVVDEDPFVRTSRQPIVIDVQGAEPGLARRLAVDVDRGVATFPYQLPGGRAYAEVAATPSATLELSVADQPLASIPWRDVLDGRADAGRVKVTLADRGRNWVHVSVVDETGRPTPCRIRLRSPDGIPYQPHGHHNHVHSDIGSWHQDVGGDVRVGADTYAYIDGTCQGWLPRGEVIVDVTRGFEYEPLHAAVEVAPGQRELRLDLRRWTDMNAAGWYSGDSHVHFLSVDGGHLEAQAEGLNVVNLLQSQWGSLYTNTEDFTGRASVSDNGRSIVYVGQENRQHFLGHLTLWGLTTPVMPWCSDGPLEAELGGALVGALSHWADEAHAQGAVTIVPHFPLPNGETAVLVATGRADGIELVAKTAAAHDQYYRYLNAGYRLPVVGGTDKMDSDTPVGVNRTYVKLGADEEFTFATWCANTIKGRTFFSSGPMIGLSVDGHEIGDTVRLSGPGRVEVHAWTESVFPLHTLEVVVAGAVVAAEPSDGGRRIDVRTSVEVDGDTWIAARTGGPGYWGGHRHLTGRHDVFAHTSPIYVAVGREWSPTDDATLRHMLTLAEGGLGYLRHVAVHERPGTVTHHHGHDDHVGWLERPFHEAIEALAARLRAGGGRPA